MSYEYDTTGQSYFFFLAVLLLFLTPFTYSVIRGGPEKAARRVPYPCVGWNSKAPEVKRVATIQSGISKKSIALALGWLLCAFVVQRASGIKADLQTYDAYSILGIATGATEKQIKKHYRRMSLKFHPDKIVLAVNQTKEDADNHFVELTKAYKSLTDEEYRTNVEMYGNPDGKQEYKQGIALPSWVVEGQNIWWVIGAYALGLGVLLPLLVGRWWYGSKKITKDGILNSTATTFFLGLEEETTFGTLLAILSASDEFATDPTLLKLRKSPGKAAVDEYARLVSTVREAEEKVGWEGFSTWPAEKKRARVLIAAHMLRSPIKDSALLREKQTTVTIALPLVTGLGSVALAHNWLSTYISILHLQQFILQAVHPSSSPLLQLPHISKEIVEAAQKSGIQTIGQFGKLGAGEVDKLTVGLAESEKKETFEVAKHWPITEFVDAKFQVVGESVVTPGSIVSLIVKLRVIPPGQEAVKTLAITGDNEFDVKAEESSIHELIGRKVKGEDGEEVSPLAHAPHFPKNRKPSWYIFVGDHKLNRVFVPPFKFTDMGPNAVRTVKISFQAPPGPGLYTFQAYVMSDSFVGIDVQKDMRMNVAVPTDPSELVGVEDDISEPDEDSLAGQMALMKGGNVKKAGEEEEDDDTSGTDESEEEAEASDSDSD